MAQELGGVEAELENPSAHEVERGTANGEAEASDDFDERRGLLDGGDEILVGP